MESDAAGGPSGTTLSPEESQALNSTILEYYKQFGRKRDLEQYFSLNTAQGEVKDVSSLFWRRMKSQDSSDSGEKSRDTSLEVCRIQIKCSAVDVGPGSSQDENSRPKSDSESPPIITEEAPKPSGTPQDSDDESDKSDEKSVKSDDNNSQKSNDAILDTSINKAYSPSSSIASQRKLEWDSLADVGYANESDKRTSASSLSTLERLALRQQYSNNDTHQDNIMGPPTAHSTPVDEADMKPKNRKGSKTTKIYRKDVEHVEVNVPQGTDANPSQLINVNLTKHISFSVDQGGEISVEKVKKDYSISPEKKSVEEKVMPQVTMDKEIQTSLIKTKDKSSSSGEIPRPTQLYGQGVPVLINLNNLKKRSRRKKVNISRKKIRIRKKLDAEKENLPVLEKSGEQVSEAESFEYMPGHIYNQNQMNNEPSRSSQTAGNKSSLESSGAVTTDSSKGSKHSFTKDLENSIKLLRATLNKRYDDAELKQKLIKQVVQRLLKSNYRDDESTTDFLSGLSFSSKKLGLGGDNNTTTSTSDATNTIEKAKLARPKKSILRVDKFNSNVIASTSQSAPNLPAVSNSENPVSTNLKKVLTSSNSSSDASSKEKTSSDTAFAKTSSEELYQKYLDALRREEAYKKHLREKEQFLKQKLVASDVGVRSSSTLTGPASRLDVKSRIKLKDLMKDLTRNNYDDGSGDASKLEGGHVHDVGLRYNEGRNQRSHSVFTLSSSGNSDQNRRPNSKKSEMKDIKAGHSKDEVHYCCCPHHYSNKIGVTDSSVQVNIRSEAENSPRINNKVAAGPECPGKSKKSQPVTHIVSDDHTGDIKYLCLSKPEVAEVQSPSENFLIYKCSRLTSKGVCCNVPELPTTSALRSRNYDFDSVKPSKGSQTSIKNFEPPAKETVCIHEAIRVTQTDISINPRISDPSLTDIKITKNCDCVKLVQEQFRQVSKSSIDSEVNVNMEQNAVQIGDNDVHNQPSTSNINRLTADAEIQSELDLQDREVQQPLGYYGDGGDYTIPIQGTNMTLKVSVGSNPINNMEILDSRGLRTMDTINSNEKMYVKEIYNNAVGTTDNASLTEDLSKGVQSENGGLFSQYEKKPRTVNTIFTNQEAYNKCPNKASVSRPQPFMRSNTFPGIEERNSDVRNEILDEFYEQEQWSTYPKTTASKVLCACSDFNRCHCEENAIQMSSQNSQNDFPNPVVVDEYKPIERSVPEVKKRQKIPCGCPESAKCGGYCGKNSSCRKQTSDLCQSPGHMEDRIPSPCKSNSEAPNKSSPRKTYPRSNKISPRKTSPRCGSPNKRSSRETSPRYEAPNKSSPRKTSPRCESPNKSSPSKTPCDCPDSAHCEGLCEDNAACGNKTTEVKECKPDGDTVSGNSPPENSDSDYPDFEKLKEYLRNQTLPQRKMRKAARSPSLPIDPKKIDAESVTTSTEYETPSDERIKEQSAAGPSKIKTSNSNELIMNVIKDVTNRYSKKDLEKGQKKKCFKEILSILNYLLDTEDAVDTDAMKDLKNLVTESSSSECYDCTVVKPTVKPGTSTSRGTCTDDVKEDKESDCMTKPTEKCEEKTTCDKGIQLSTKKSKPAKCCIESSDLPCTSSDSVTCKVLNKIRKECEKYHRKCCKRHQSPKSCQCSSTTSMSCDQCKRIVFCQCRAISANCDQCKRVHHCQCRPPNRCKCKGYRPKSVCERVKKKCVAYNLILQTSESMVSEEFTRDCRPLKNIIVKVPPRKPSTCNVPFKEMEREIGPQCSPRSEGRSQRSKSCPNDSLSSTDDCAKGTIYSVKDYLEKNRPDFIEQSGQRQKCLKMISEASDQCRPCSSCKSCRPCSPTLKTIVIHGPTPTSTPRCAPHCTLFCRGVQMGCDPYKSDPSKPSDPCRPCDPCDPCIPCKPCDPCSPCGPCSPCDPCSPCSSFDPCNPCVDSNQMQVTTIEPPKLISEREMKKHSERIYKKLPEVVQKKEDLKKENIKKTNLLMANIFKKNLQKKTLRGAVNLSNYSSVIKI